MKPRVARQFAGIALLIGSLFFYGAGTAGWGWFLVLALILIA